MKQRDAFGFWLGYILTFIGLFLILDELHEFGLPIPRIFPDMSQWSMKPLEHWMYGVILLCVGLSVLLTNYLFYRRRR